MQDKFYITTPIYYVNAEPHLGHAYTTIVADVATRFARMNGLDARFQTGTDEHGDKIAQAAEKKGVDPQAFTDRVSGLFRDTWPKLNIEYDRFIRTTDADHVKTVQAILQKVYDAGDIYPAKYGGNYCVGCERFLTDKELVDGKCPDHNTEPDYIEEENYFFRMSKYQQALIDHIKANPDFIRPERYKNEVLSFLSEPLDDLCISRPKSRLTWGITLPFDEKFVTYVWFDALINYLTGLEWPNGADYEKYWPKAQHLIAKDILKPHGIYWPTMLMAAGVPLYRHLNVHGFWNLESGKMSKSLGNVVAPLDLAGIYGTDAFRYYVMREMTFGLDAAFGEKALVARYNADLANDLGNLASRVLNMLARYRNGLLPELHADALTDEDRLTLDSFKALAELDPTAPGESGYGANMEGFSFHHALAAVWKQIRHANKYIVRTEPWELAKDAANDAALDNVLHILVQELAALSQLIWPVMPETAEKLAELLDYEVVCPVDWERLFSLTLLEPGCQTAKPKALFPRIDTDKIKAKAEKKAKAQKKKEPKAKKKKEPAGPAPEITIDEFLRTDLKLGTVLDAENIKGADRILKLSIDLGEEKPRTVVAGIAQHYKPEEIKGKQVVVVANLKPVTLRGITSQGMVLTAVTDDKVKVVAPGEVLSPGSKIR